MLTTISSSAEQPPNTATAVDFIIALAQAQAIRTSPELLELYSSSHSSLLRGAVASNLCCPPELLAQLAVDTEPYVRGRVAQNQNCPTMILLLLWEDKEERVQAFVSDTMLNRAYGR